MEDVYIYADRKLFFKMQLPTQANQATDTGYRPADKWMAGKEVLSMLFIGERTLQRWRSKGIIPYSRIGNKIYYRLGDIEALLKSRMVGGS